VDDVMVQLMKVLNLPIPEYSREKDPTKLITDDKLHIDWTIPDSSVKIMRKLYEGKCCKQSRKRGYKPSVERKGGLFDFEQMKRSKPKEEEEEKCENDSYTSETHHTSKQTVAQSLESESNVKEKQECYKHGIHYEVKPENYS
jgi:hypothetical protein